jgi:hypothetical protein
LAGVGTAGLGGRLLGLASPRADAADDGDRRALGDRNAEPWRDLGPISHTRFNTVVSPVPPLI